MVIPCLCFFTNGSDLHCSCPVPTNRGGANGAPAGGAFLVDIPSRWKPRAKQQPTGLLFATPAAWPCCSRPVPPTQKIPSHLTRDFCGGALSAAVEPLGRHIVAAVRALQTEKRRHFGTLQPLLVCFFQLIFVQGNAVQQITLILGSCIVINAEPFADCAELVKHFNSSRGHSFDFNIHGSTTFQERYVLKSESAALSASISMIGPPDCLAKTRIAPKSRI